jgi:hypothetical protein
VFAQKERGRVGALWFLIALIVEGGFWALFAYIAFNVRFLPDVYFTSIEEADKTMFITALVGMAIGFVIMMIVVSTLPKRDAAAPAAAHTGSRAERWLKDTRVCPHCAEEIKAAAKVCRFCNREVAPTSSA